jgi:hypothetical protein
LEKRAVIARCLLVCSALLLLFANGAYGRGSYQRTKDGKTLVWNNYPGHGEEVEWSGDRDPNGYAIGQGTLTWYRVEQPIVTGSSIPSARRERIFGVYRYSGKMVRGKLEGPVNADAKGKTFHATFVKGSKIGDWVAGSAPSATPNTRRHERVPEGAAVAASGQAATPTPPDRRAEPVIETPTQGSASLELARPPSSLRMPVVAAASPQASIPSTPSGPSSNPAAVDPAVKDRMIADFKDETQSVLSRVTDATGNFRDVDRLESVQKLPGPVSESVSSLVERGRDFRAKVGYETALHEYRTEIQTVDALAVVDQITRNIAANDASAASSTLADFLKSNPEPTAESEKALWRYLTSMRSLCSRLEKDADMHLQKAQSLASAGKKSEAIREYQEANRIFPKPATAEKIRQLQGNGPEL